MREDRSGNIRPRPGGGPGAIKAFDPAGTSFKDAAIAVVFACIWLEALLHLLIVRGCGLGCFRKGDKNLC